TTLPIVLVDERLTSTMAENSLKSLDQNRKKRSENVDTVAATFILQNYLDKNLIAE
ncbi:MAG: Holliday junction resolvase RuvX, partial [Proteobacteria bacterium]|nr:Holliday junction resolvase RuvX [Pseudomonadota bacterium]